MMVFENHLFWCHEKHHMNVEMKKINFIILILILFFFLSWASKAQPLMDVETGLVIPGYNDVRIPGNQGTLFSLKDDLKAETKLFYRLRAAYTFKLRHTISLLYAPLEINSEGIPDKAIFFEGVTFPAGNPLNGTYQFNSYRLTYRYDIIDKARIVFGLGFTAKIRDAEISLSSPGLSAGKTNVGFVPIINFRLLWKIDEKFGLLLEGDALAAPQGRAEDILLAATYHLSNKFGFRAGYRILEGGADNDEVYNFALFHYLSFGFHYHFNHSTKSK